MNQRLSGVGLLTALAFALSFLNALYLGAFGVILLRVGDAFGLGAAIQGRLFLTSFFGSAAGVLLCGYLSDHFGRKPLMLFCLGAVAVGMTLFGSATTFSAVLIGATLIGGGCAAAQTVAAALLSDLHSARRAFYLNAMQTVFSIGAVLASPLMQGLLALGGTWRTLFAVMGVVAVTLFVLLTFQRIPSRIENTEDSDAPSGMNLALVGSLLRQPTVILFCVSGALYAGAEVAFASWMPTFLQKEISGGAKYAGYVISIFWVAMSVGRALTGLLLHRFPLRRLRFLLAFAATITATLTLLTISPLLALWGVLLTGLCFSGIWGLFLADVSGRYPHAAGTLIGVIGAAGAIGCALIPFAVGALAGAGFSWRVALSLAPLAALLMAGLTLIRSGKELGYRVIG